MKRISHFCMERGCVAETSRSSSEVQVALKSTKAPYSALLLRLVEDDTAALRFVSRDS